MMSKQSMRMLFQRSLFSGVSNLPKSSVGTLLVSSRAKTGFGGVTLANPRDNVKSDFTKDTSGFVKATGGDRRGVQPQAGSGQKKKEPFLPFSHFLTDLHGREHDYLRISISERCP